MATVSQTSVHILKIVRSYRQSVVASLFMAVLLFSLFGPLVSIYAEGAAEVDTIDLTNPDQKTPKPLQNDQTAPTTRAGTRLNPVTHKLEPANGIVTKPVAVSDAAKKTAVTKDPVKTYQEEEAKKAKNKLLKY